MIEFQLKKLAEDVPTPQYATPHSSGMDLCAYIPEPYVLKPLKRALIPTGFCIALHHNTEAQIRPRSGLALKHGVTVLNTPGTIDADYRGEIKVILINLGEEDFTIEPLIRIAQMVITPTVKTHTTIVEEFDEETATNRNVGGFGSTGLF